MEVPLNGLPVAVDTRIWACALLAPYMHISYILPDDLLADGLMNLSDSLSYSVTVTDGIFDYLAIFIIFLEMSVAT
jgi:hypothetical protein